MVVPLQGFQFRGSRCVRRRHVLRGTAYRCNTLQTPCRHCRMRVSVSEAASWHPRAAIVARGCVVGVNPPGRHASRAQTDQHDAVTIANNNSNQLCAQSVPTNFSNLVTLRANSPSRGTATPNSSAKRATTARAPAASSITGSAPPYTCTCNRLCGVTLRYRTQRGQPTHTPYAIPQLPTARPLRHNTIQPVVGGIAATLWVQRGTS